MHISYSTFLPSSHSDAPTIPHNTDWPRPAPIGGEGDSASLLAHRPPPGESRRSRTARIMEMTLHRPPLNTAPVRTRTHSPTEARRQIGPASTFEGQVHVKDGGLASDQPQINALLRYAKLDPQLLNMNGPAALTFTLDPGVSWMREELADVLTVKEVDLRPCEGTPLAEAKARSLDADLFIVHMQEMLQKGRAYSNLAVEAEGAGMHIYDAFALRSPSVSSPHKELAEAIQRKIDADPDLRAKLAAASILQIATKKETDFMGLAGSLTVASGLGTSWELLAYPAIAAAVKAGLSAAGLATPTVAILSTVGNIVLESVPPLLIETLDNLFVLSILERMKGNTEGRMLDKLPEAATAGIISAVLSVPDNVAEAFKSSVTALNAMIALTTNQLAVFGAASGVPAAIKRDTDRTHAAVVAHLAGGQLALPEGRDIIAHAEDLTQRAMAIDPSTGIATQSMAVTSVAGAVPAILGSSIFNLLDESVLRIVRSILFQPIEAESMHVLVAMSRFGIPGLVESDSSRHGSLIQTILEKAGAGHGGGEVPIQAAELDAIFRPRKAVLGHVGKVISDGINGSLGGAHSLAAKVGLMKKPAPRLGDQVDVEAIRRRNTFLV